LKNLLSPPCATAKAKAARGTGEDLGGVKKLKKHFLLKGNAIAL